MANAFGLTPKDVTRGLILGTVFVVVYFGILFGEEITRYREMSRALAALETCETDHSCEQAWAMLRAAKGGR